MASRAVLEQDLIQPSQVEADRLPIMKERICRVMV